MLLQDIHVMPVISPRLLHFKHIVEAAEVRESKKACHTCNTEKGLWHHQKLCSGRLGTTTTTAEHTQRSSMAMYEETCKRWKTWLPKSATCSEYLYYIFLRIQKLLTILLSLSESPAVEKKYQTFEGYYIDICLIIAELLTMSCLSY